MAGSAGQAVTSAEAPARGETAEQRRVRLAAALIGVTREPAGFAALDLCAREAHSYHQLNPYPWWHFRDWKPEERGPYPRCMPFGRTAVLRSARWLFGKPLQIQVGGGDTDSPLEEFLRDAWTRNSMRSRMRAAAEMAGQQGGVALKYSYDATRSQCPLRFQVLSTVDHCRLFYDPMDRDTLLMARVQFPYFDAVVGKWFFYREEWTAQTEVHYLPVEAQFVERVIQGIKWPPIAVVAATNEKPDVSKEWREDYRQPNPFGVIPLQAIHNLDAGGEYGIGDLWDLYRTWDRANLTYHLLDKGNQFDTEPNLVFVDLAAEQQDLDRPLAPGQPISLKSDDGYTGEKRQGQVVMLEPRRAGAAVQMDYIKDVRRQMLLAAGNIEITPEDVTNKGNLTTAVLTQLYQPLIELTDEKRVTYGENGVQIFLELCAVGLKNLSDGAGSGRIKEVAGVDAMRPETYDVQLQWPPYFQLQQDELAALVARQAQEVAEAFTTRDRATRAVAVAEGVDDIDALLTEVAVEQERLEQQDQAQLDAAVAAVDAAKAQASGPPAT